MKRLHLIDLIEFIYRNVNNKRERERERERERANMCEFDKRREKILEQTFR